MSQTSRIDKKLKMMALARVRYVLNVGIVVYALFAVMHAVLLKGEVREVMLPVALISAMGMYFMRWFIRRPEFDSGHIHIISFLTYFTFIANSGIHLYAASEIHQSTNLMLCTLGAGVFFNTLRFGVPAIVTAVAIWGAAASPMTSDYLFAHYLFGMLTATIVGYAFLVGLSRQAYALASKEVESEDREIVFTALGNVSDDAAIIARGGLVIAANRNMLELLGMREADVVGLELARLFPDNIRDAAMRFISGSDAGRIEVDILASKDRRIPVGIAHKPLTLAGEIVTALAVRPLDETKVAPRGDFDTNLRAMAAGVAHEINNPLTIVYGHFSLVWKLFKSRQFQDQRIGDGFETISTALTRISDTIASLMSLATTNSVSVRPLTVDEVLQNSLPFVRQRFSDAGVMIQVANGAEGMLIPCRGQEVSQVLISLLINSLDAVKGTKNPTVAISVVAQAEKVMIRVVDSGNGIPPATAAMLFTPFFTTKAPGAGQGLGLSVSRKKISDHGGSLEYKADATKTTFEISLPQWKDGPSGLSSPESTGSNDVPHRSA